MAAAGLLLLSTGCQGFFGVDEPEEARVILEIDQGVSVQLVTSNDFLVTGSGSTEEVEFASADTTTVSTAFDRVYPLGSAVRFYVEAEGTGEGSYALWVYIDGEEKYSRSQDAGEAPLVFTYTYSQAG